MKDESKSKAQLIEELNRLRRQVTSLQAIKCSDAPSSRTPQFVDTLLDTIPVPVFYKDVQGIYRDCNRAFAERIVVINELATNVVKYALSGQKRTCLTVRITRQNSTARLEFQDNGPGYPDQILEMEQHGVGLYLIRAMVQDSLNGMLTLYTSNGAATEIRFPIVVNAAEME